MSLRRGTKGNDSFIASAAAEQFDGVQGYDKVIYANASFGIVIDLNNLANNTGAADGDTYTNVRSFLLTKFDDRFVGSAGRDIANGDSGNDRLEGGANNDTLTGHSGNDTLLGGTGSDAMWGGGNNDAMFGGSDNDKMWGDSGLDVISGGADDGSVAFATTSVKYYQYGAGLLIPLSQIDDAGEWVVVPKYHNISDAGQLTSLGRAEGDAIFVITNGYNSARNWNAQPDGKGQPIDLGPHGQIDPGTSVIFNAGPAPGTLRIVGEVGRPGPKAAGSNPDSVVIKTTHHLSDVTFGDTLTGGSGADTFIFNAGDGVDCITDFEFGVDHIDLNEAWHDGNTANGEFSVRSYAGGALILFTDTSADGFVNDTAIFLSGRSPASVDGSIFI